MYTLLVLPCPACPDFFPCDDMNVAPQWAAPGLQGWVSPRRPSASAWGFGPPPDRCGGSVAELPPGAPKRSELQSIPIEQSKCHDQVSQMSSNKAEPKRIARKIRAAQRPSSHPLPTPPSAPGGHVRARHGHGNRRPWPRARCCGPADETRAGSPTKAKVFDKRQLKGRSGRSKMRAPFDDP